MKVTILILLFWVVAISVKAQDPAGERIKKELTDHPQPDTFRVNRLLEMVYYSRDENYYLEALAISRKIGYVTGEGYAITHLAFSKSRRGQRAEGDSLFRRADSIAKKTGNSDLQAMMQVYQAYSTFLVDINLGSRRLLTAEKTTLKSGNKKLLSICHYYMAVEYANGKSNLPAGMEYYLKAIQTAEEVNYLRMMCSGFIAVGQLYNRMGDSANSAIYYQKARDVNTRLKSPIVKSQLLNREGSSLGKAGRWMEAIDVFKRSLQSAKDADSVLIVTILTNLADAYAGVDSLSLAFKYGFYSARFARKVGDNLLLSEVVVSLSKTYLKNKMPDSAIYYARLGYDSSKSIGAVQVMGHNAENLAKAYAYKKDFANAYAWHLLYINHRDSVLNTETRNKSAVAQYNADLEKKQAQIISLNQQKKVQLTYLYSVLAVLLLIIITAFVLLKSNRQKQKANKLLQQQKLEIEYQRDQTNQALDYLQHTQKQLIQAEKMASLGELTAGIAHEIQNPLNFVNNFSEVNRELIEELKSQKLKVKTGRSEEMENELLNDLAANEDKIIHHGKRADAIVKSMLLHSQGNKGIQEPTDINTLAEEYLRISYNSIVAKDGSFQVNLKTDFDKTIGKINMIPQDIGRVLLNIYNNAFYSMAEKMKDPGHTENYHPIITVSTIKGADTVRIKITDNGDGIPQKVLDKIFQPFFTTKPTGQGTGLGLSLSYDILKAHGGEIKAETIPGEGATFLIGIPLKNN